MTMIMRSPRAALQLLLAIITLCSTFTAATTLPLPRNKDISRQQSCPALSTEFVIQTDFADPSLIQVNGTWYSFATSTIRDGKGYRIQAARSFDFDNWIMSNKDALAFRPAWVAESRSEYWAPDVVQVDDGSFVMYFSARANFGTQTHCIGAATTPDITQPFNPLPDPLFYPQSSGGAIDASGFRDEDGTSYVLYKVDGNTLGHGGSCNNFLGAIVPTPIMLQRVHGDGITKADEPAVEILNRGEEDGPLVEAPSMMVKDGTYYLFYSSNCYSTEAYDVSWAVSDNIAGPFEKTGTLFETGTAGLLSPGGASVAADGEHMVLHARNVDTGRRSMRTTRVSVDGPAVSS